MKTNQMRIVQHSCKNNPVRVTQFSWIGLDWIQLFERQLDWIRCRTDPNWTGLFQMNLFHTLATIIIATAKQRRTQNSDIIPGTIRKSDCVTKVTLNNSEERPFRTTVKDIS